MRRVHLAEHRVVVGLEPVSERPPDPLERRRPPNPKPDLSPEMREDLVARLRRDVEQLVSPEIDVSLWPNFRDVEATAVPNPRVALSKPIG